MATHGTPTYPQPTTDAHKVHYEFTPAEIAEVQKHVAKYPDKTSAVMPVLWLAQEKYGVLSTGAIQLVADTLGLPFSHVYGVATFYTMYLKRGVPEKPFHLVEVCTCFTCGECGGKALFDNAARKLNLDDEGFSADKQFWLREAECLGACDTPGVVQVNNRRLLMNVDDKKLDQIFTDLRAGNTPPFESVPAKLAKA